MMQFEILKNVQIPRKIALVLALFFLLCAALTTLAAININGLAQRTENLVNNEAVVLSETASAQENFTRMHQLAFELSGAPHSDFSPLLARFEDEHREMQERLNDIVHRLSPVDEEMQDVIASSVSEYEGMWTAAQVPLRAGHHAEFDTILRTHAIEIWQRGDDAFDRLVTAQTEHLQTASRTARAQASAALLLLVSGSVLGLLFVSALALVIVGHGVAAPLGAVTKAMNRLAAGDRNAEPFAATRRDEIGDLMRAFDAFRQAATERDNALAEAERQRARAEEERERNAEESAARNAAEEANRLKSQFLANMSHELRTPLNAIIGYTEIVEEELSGERTEHHCLPDLARVTKAARHLLSLINDVLDLAKIESGAVSVEVTAFQPASVIEDVVALAQPIADKSNTRLRWLGAEALPSMRTDQRALKQCLLNLVSNACKFTRNGTVDIAAERAVIDGRAMLKLSVIDSGIGMSEEQMSRVFEAFEQADSSITTAFGGTGLGLSISRRLARILGGDVWFDSTPGEGTTAYLSALCDLEEESSALPTRVAA